MEEFSWAYISPSQEEIRQERSHWHNHCNFNSHNNYVHYLPIYYLISIPRRKSLKLTIELRNEEIGMGLDGFLSRQTRREIIKKGNRMPNGKWYLYAFAFMIVVLLSIVLILIFIDFMESPQESVFHRYIDRLNDGDAKGATDLTIYSFMSYDEYMNEVHYLEDFIEQYGEQKIWIDENEMIGKDHLWAMYKNEIEYHIEWFESEYGVEVEDYCALNVAISNFDNHFEDRYDEMECYKIDSNWYLVYP